MVYTIYYCINHKKQITNQLEQHRIDLSYFNKRSNEEEILDNLNLPFKIKIEKEKRRSVKLPYWTPAIISTVKLLKKLMISDHSDQGPKPPEKRDKIIDELLRQSPVITRDCDDFDLNIPEELF